MTKRKPKKELGCFIGEDVKITGKMREFITNECSTLRIIPVPNEIKISTGPKNLESDQIVDLPTSDTFFQNNDPYIKIQDSELRNWSDYDFKRHYGTHDWLAHNALKIILKDDELNARWKFLGEKDFWSEERVKLFLYGTAGPDYSNPEGNNYIMYNGIKEDYSKRSNSWHLIRLDENRKISRSMVWVDLKTSKSDEDFNQEFNTADRARFWQLKSNRFLKEKKYNESVFCMGMMTHYIADTACFPHVLNPYSSLKGISSFRNLTGKQINEVLRRFLEIHDDYEYEVNRKIIRRNQEDFFTIKSESIALNLRKRNLDASSAIIDLAINVTNDARWMLTFYKDFMGKYWKQLDQITDWHDDIYWKEINERNTYHFLKLIEKHLNIAIEYIAHSLLSIIEDNDL